MGAAPGSLREALDAALRSLRTVGMDPFWSEHSVALPARLWERCDALRDAVTVLEPKAFFPFYFSNAAHFLSAEKPVDEVLRSSYVVHLFGAGRWKVSDERLWVVGAAPPTGGGRASRANEAPFRRNACGRRARRPSRAWRSTLEVATASWRAGTPAAPARRRRRRRPSARRAGRARVRARRDGDRGALARFRWLI